MKKKKDEITIRSSAGEYRTYVAFIGDQQDSIEMRYEDENIWMTQKMMATLMMCKNNKAVLCKDSNKMYYAVHGHTAAGADLRASRCR